MKSGSSRSNALRRIHRAVVAGIVASAALLALAADEDSPDQPTGDVLLLNSVGQTVSTPMSDVPKGIRPSSDVGLKHQTPRPHKGTLLTTEVADKLKAAQEGLPTFEYLPAAPPRLMPYLYGNDEFGNTAIQPGALIDVVPLEPVVQQGKYRLSEIGLRYSLEQTFTYAGMTDLVNGDNNLGNYNLDLTAKWTVFDAREAGTAGWISTQIEYQTAIGVSGPTQNAQTNIGSVTNPTAFWSTHSGWRVPELAWQQSFGAGHVVALVGMINQGNYLDANAYANSGRGQFINSALVNTLVMPLPAYGYGVNLKWQPNSDWYAMFGDTAGSGAPGEAPKQDFSWTMWSLLWEVGYTPADMLGLGPGVYRVQPFVARADGPVQGGLCFNFQQQLGAKSPFGWYGRLGFGGSQVAAGAKAQASIGLVLNAPLKYAGWAPQLSNDILGMGVVWSQPSATTKTVYHNNEYVFETFYTLQLSPTSQLQPDLQIVWNPAFNPNSGPAVVFQFQFILKW